MRRLLPILGCVLALVLSSCSSSTESGSGSVTTEDRPDSFEDLDFSSPLGDLLGFSFGSEDSEAEFAELQREAGRLTAACMLEKGFEYTPQVDSIVSFGGSGDELPYFSAEWVNKYGFGITTQRFPQSSVGELVGYPDEQFSGDAPPDDPNEDYLNGLTDGERDAYYAALYGAPTDFQPGEQESFPDEPEGCQAEGFNVMQGDVDIDRFVELFESDLDAMQERAESDPRVVEYRERVAACVSDAGQTYTTEQDVYELFESRLEAISPNFDGDPFEAAGVDPEELSEREIDEIFTNMNRIDPADIPALAELQAEEIALAKIVVGCDGGPLNEQVLLGEIRSEYEQQFIDANADALEEFRADG